MDTNQLIELATRTESKIDNVTLNIAFITNVLQIAISAGKLLDQAKKHAFYDKDYDKKAIIKEFENIVTATNTFTVADLDEIDTNELPIATNTRVFHSIVGIATESTELLEAMKLTTAEIDEVNLLEEMFDVDWYKFILLDEINGDQQLMWENGFNKLRVRFPDKFTNDDAINRDLQTERKILEQT